MLDLYRLKNIGARSGTVYFFFALVVPVLIAGYFATTLQALFGGYNQDLFDLIAAQLDRDTSSAHVVDYSASSISGYLQPYNFLSFIIFGFLRSILYIIAPFPAYYFNAAECMRGCLNIFVVPLVFFSGFLNALLLPFFGWLVWNFGHLKVQGRLLVLSCSILILFVGYGNGIIVERYRSIFSYIFLLANIYHAIMFREKFFHLLKIGALFSFLSFLAYVFFKAVIS